jgi:4-hydroxy-3-polyprenylbenzoate decarboxylase
MISMQVTSEPAVPELGPRGYRDLHEHLEELERRGLLQRITIPVCKDTELHPLVRWQYRGGIPESERKAFLFEKVTDARGRRYDHAVVVGALAATPAVYAAGLRCAEEEVPGVWERALANPIEPVVVDQGVCQEVVQLGADVLADGAGLDAFPIPISTPGFDNAPYLTAGHWISRSPETGARNMGNYRGQIKARDRVGMYVSGFEKGMHGHWIEAKRRGEPLEVAVIVGAPPAVSYTAVQKLPDNVDELAVAGGLAGEPIRLVRCKTVNLEVPADAELVIEGRLRTDLIEPEGPFGESHGYVHQRSLSPWLEVTAITHRGDYIYSSILSQVTPSESSVIKKAGYEMLFYTYLRSYLGIRSVRRVYMHEPLTNLRKFVVLQMRQPRESDVWRALMATATRDGEVGKIVVAVDEDIDPENLDAVMWALCYRMKPHLDVQIVHGRNKGHSPPFHEAPLKPGHQQRGEDSMMLINATLKEPYPPLALPKREYMERARDLWEELGLPRLRPEAPWHGYTMGDWSDELEAEAQLAVQGDHFETGAKQATRRVPPSQSSDLPVVNYSDES